MDLLRHAQEVGLVVEDARDFETFMAPEGEDDEPDEQEVVLQDIIDHYTGNAGCEAEPDEDDGPTPPPLLNKAHQALETLQSFFETRESSTINDMKHLHALRQRLTQESIQTRK